ncbi:MAG: cysteine--tRNA ligase [Crenarchaeota archaeon]|nr:cysteine--tRNA ligase [Thermoproteota archaeon]MDW8034619.1 cysteine--tRNA ligase [Nitrososphaerota archaeon]
MIPLNKSRDVLIYNTLTRRVEKLATLHPGEVRMYVCGPTVYDVAHLGHARAEIVYDSFRRFLEYLGYRVILVRNITDVDDKIINRAREENRPASEIALQYTVKYFIDTLKLGIKHPTFNPRVTDHIPDIIGFVSRLIEKGYAYESGGDVYFSVKKYQGYGELSGQSLDRIIAGARIEPGENKKDPLDFALWKAAKPGEVFWESPWGRGRPGWHIECSTMSMKYLGETLDIHAGGMDLIFPHHENERAQSEALTGKKFVNIWMHHGPLTVNGEKMSKSLGNYVTIEDALKRFDADTLRFYILSTHYRSPLDYNEQALESAKKGLDKVRRIIIRLGDISGDGEAEELEEEVLKHLANDFNTPRAIAVLMDAANQIIERINKGSVSKSFLGGFLRLWKMLGFFQSGVERSTERERRLVEVLVTIRSEARASGDYKLADKIREELNKIGIVVEDTPEGTFTYIL